MNRFESFPFNSEAIQKPEKPEASFEVMTTPTIIVQEEQGAQLLSVLFKANNPNWGETTTPLAQETTEYFTNNPLTPDIIATLKTFADKEIDEETLYNCALTYQRPDRKDAILKMIEKHKEGINNPEALQQQVVALLANFESIFVNSPLAEKLTNALEQDKTERLQRIEATKTRIKSLIDFFQPDAQTTTIKTLNFAPTDPLYKQNSGRTFMVSTNEQIIISHIDNTDNQDHEFCHSIINPIVEKLSQQLTTEHKEKISQLASEKLKQDYGNEYFSLLCEEFIRTYNDIWKHGKQPATYEAFVSAITNITEDQWQTVSANLKPKLQQLKINTLADLKNKSQEYFAKFNKNSLRDLIFELYQEYSERPDQKNENFERFILSKFTTKLMQNFA